MERFICVSDSFAGAYETVLDVYKDDIKTAVETVVASAGNERVKAYRMPEILRKNMRLHMSR